MTIFYVMVPLRKIEDHVVKLLRKAINAEGDDRAELLKQVAFDLVEARQHFPHEDGDVDWRGRSYAYRTFVGSCYSGLGVSGDDLASLKASVRYHVSTALRERLVVEGVDPADVGLRPMSARDRASEMRAVRTAAVHEARGGAYGDARDSFGALRAAHHLLRGLDENALFQPQSKRRDEAVRLVQEIQVRAVGLIAIAEHLASTRRGRGV